MCCVKQVLAVADESERGRETAVLYTFPTLRLHHGHNHSIV